MFLWTYSMEQRFEVPRIAFMCGHVVGGGEASAPNEFFKTDSFFV